MEMIDANDRLQMIENMIENMIDQSLIVQFADHSGKLQMIEEMIEEMQDYNNDLQSKATNMMKCDVVG